MLEQNVKSVLILLNDRGYSSSLSWSIIGLDHSPITVSTIAGAKSYIARGGITAMVFSGHVPEHGKVIQENLGLKYALTIMDEKPHIGLGFYSAIRSVPPEYNRILDNCVIIDPLSPNKGLLELLK